MITESLVFKRNKLYQK